MPLLIGQPIDARELEQVTSTWSPERFASMCNDLVWAISGRHFSTAPSFTERVNAADSGIDAEWDIELPDDQRTLPTPIVGTGWNVFQYKKRDIIAQDRKRIISSFKASLKRSLADLCRERKRHPDHYIFFCNVDLNHEQTLALKDAVLEGYDHVSDVHVEVIGAAELSAFLNSHPHLRAAYFAPLVFKTWAEANRSHRRQKLFGFDVELVGRDDVLTRLRALVDDPQVRVVVLSGQHDIGKSRLVLESTAHRRQYAVFALDPRSMKLADYRALATDQRDILCVVEDPDPEELERFITEVLSIDGIKTIVTLPSSGQAPLLSYGTDERIQLLCLESLTDEDSRKLVAATGKRLDLGVESWILHRAGGNPGVLLAAVSIGERLRSETKNFEEAVGSEFAKRIESELGAEALECARLLSPLTHVGVSGRFETELKLICRIFGVKTSPAIVLSSLQRLEKAGLAKRGGSFAEISIPLLANCLTRELLRGRKTEVFALFAELDESGRHRFFRRLCQVRSEELDLFWHALFDPNEPSAPFGKFESALRYIGVLAVIAGAAPERVVQLLESGLLNATHEERLLIADEARREIMWALEQLLFRKKTSRRALTLVWLLAEAENETWGNNATGLLAECFHPKHGQMPLPLDERLEVFREFTSHRVTKAGKLVAIRAASKALQMTAYHVRQSTGPEPLDKRPVFNRQDAYEYMKGLVDVFFDIAVAEEKELAGEALQELPRLVFLLGIQGQPKEAFERFERLVDWAKSERSGLEVFSLFENIHALCEGLRDTLHELHLPDDLKVHFALYLDKLERLKNTLENGTFSLRLKRWATGWSPEHQQKILVDGVEQYRSCVELKKLAKETIREPSLLTADLTSWLLSGNAQNAHAYFFELGKEDAEGHVRSKLEALGSQAGGARAFSAYWGGWSLTNRAEAESRLVLLADSNAISGDAVAWAAANVGPSDAILEILKEKVLELYVTPELVSGVLYGDWIRGLSAQQFLQLSETIAGAELEKAALAIEVIGRWIDENRPLEPELVDFAWRCFEAVPTITRNNAYSFDKVASKLGQIEPECGFRVLDKLLRVPHDRHTWNPIDRFSARENQFWKVLHDFDPERAIRTIFCAALTALERRFWITSDFQEIIDQTDDAGVLTKLASESESLAEVIAESTTAARPGFWPLTFKLIEKHPGSLNIKSALTSGITHAEGGWGAYSSRLTSSRQEVERVLNDPATPPAARPWLRDILNRLEGNVAQHVIWEYDEDVNDLRRYIEIDDKNSPERSWAIARILKYADWKDIKRMLTVDDIEEALPQVDLPERKRKTLEKALEVWRGET